MITLAPSFLPGECLRSLLQNVHVFVFAGLLDLPPGLGVSGHKDRERRAIVILIKNTYSPISYEITFSKQMFAQGIQHLESARPELQA